MSTQPELNTKLSNNMCKTIANIGRAYVTEALDGKLYVTINGVRFAADKNDIFGRNKDLNQWLENLVNFYDKRMEEKKEELELLEKMKEGIIATIKAVKETLHKFLESLGVNSTDKITNTFQKNIAEGFEKKIISFKFSLTSIKNRIFSVCLDSFMAACSKAKAVMQLPYNQK